MTDLQAFLLKLTQNLNLLQEREAKYGANPPLELANQISDHQEAIALTEQVIRGELGEAEWREALQPLLAAVAARPGEAASGLTPGDIGGSIQPSTLAGRDVNQVTLNVVNLMRQSLTQPGRAPEPAAQAITDLVLEQVQALDPRAARQYPQNPVGFQAGMSSALAELLAADRGLAARLDVLLARYEQAVKESSTGGGASYQASLKGSGAIAQGPGAVAAGAGGIAIGGSVTGNISLTGRPSGEDEEGAS